MCDALQDNSWPPNSAFDISASMKLANARALALACRPAGKRAHKSTAGSDQSSNMDMTAPDLSSG
ncbi:MAG TPA: hypothetical protein VH230_05860, partial [Stellaceae bacterium]|nr:hypothetical protein [Stellaceae bacterium]